MGHKKRRRFYVAPSESGLASARPLGSRGMSRELRHGKNFWEERVESAGGWLGTLETVTTTIASLRMYAICGCWLIGSVGAFRHGDTQLACLGVHRSKMHNSESHLLDPYSLWKYQPAGY